MNVFYNGRSPIVDLSGSSAFDSNDVDVCHACRSNAFSSSNSKTEEYDSMCKQDTIYCRQNGKIIEFEAQGSSCPRENQWTVRSFEKLEKKVFDTNSGNVSARISLSLSQQIPLECYEILHSRSEHRRVSGDSYECESWNSKLGCISCDIEVVGKE